MCTRAPASIVACAPHAPLTRGHHAHARVGAPAFTGNFFCRWDRTKCYQVIESDLSYWDSVEACQGIGGRLASFKTLEEYTEFNQLMLAYNSFRPYDAQVGARLP